jgi:hypothetical protein
MRSSTELSSQTSSPVSLLRAMIDGARGDGTLHVALVLAVRRADEDQIAPDDRRRVREVVRIGPHFLHHVELPHDIGVVGSRPFLVREGAGVAVAESVHVQREDHRAIAHVVEPLVLDDRRGGDALERPVVRAARFELPVRVLPEELAVRRAEGLEHATVAVLLRIAEELVVRADEDHAVGDHRVAVGLRPEVGHPLHIASRLHVPVRGGAGHRRHHVAVGGAAPHRPLTGGGRVGGGRGRHQARQHGGGAEHRNREGTGWTHALNHHECLPQSFGVTDRLST